MATLQALGVTLSCGLGTKNNLKGILRRTSCFHNVTEQLVEWKVRAIQQLTLVANVWQLLVGKASLLTVNVSELAWL